MKKILFFLTIIFSLPTFADHHLVIEMNNLKEHSYSLQDKPIISFENNKLIIKTTKIEISYNIFDIVKYYFAEVNDTGVNDINEEINKIHFTYTNPFFLLIEGVSNIKDVNVYDTRGRVCIVNYERNDNSIKVELKSLPKGIYIIKVNNHSFKIIR